uniref:Uncharacterized protein n=1 Tax=Chromera velia CCMP2878 TaxID=1169474 RepID=A0A0G4GFE3_9ALVE|eukprot:Cvel_21655.t1-p1 / transcript=Cvel_21655.t1 / gene=Cvel_21655 / organism=Chromera_velia_CCMP2878 / gene_product=hypothetical protein / transcript_product=hypothetical protein / location=Cvel_scaffold2048:28883-29164(+) / protein_length=94 / sequence_SO=supercontig / SO=protein_coding / is_pseudo=false
MSREGAKREEIFKEMSGSTRKEEKARGQPVYVSVSLLYLLPAGGCRCFGGPLGSLGIASPPCSTGIDGGLGGASRLCVSIYVELDGVPPGVSLR